MDKDPRMNQFYDGRPGFLTPDGEPLALVVRGITDEMVKRGAAVYQFGVMPGDESEATEEEIREMTRRVLEAALSHQP